jgi:RecA/RadA recombinase
MSNTHHKEKKKMATTSNSPANPNPSICEDAAIQQRGHELLAQGRKKSEIVDQLSKECPGLGREMIDLYVTGAIAADLEDLDPTAIGIKERQEIADREIEAALQRQEQEFRAKQEQNSGTTASSVREGKAILAETYSQRKARMDHRPPALIPGLLPRNEVVLLAGDSGEGKSPLVVQLMLCVASGTPFLNIPVQAGKVLYVDYENGDQLLEFEESVMQALSLNKLPEQNYSVIEMPESSDKLEKEIASYKPDLVIIDTLRQYAPASSSKNELGSSEIGRLRKMARKYSSTIIILHHLRKPGEQGVKDRDKQLIHTDVVEWMEEVEGARALVNHVYARIGMEKYTDARSKKCELVLKVNYKGAGDGPPIYVGRSRFDDGKPKGYFRVPGSQILPDEVKKIYAQLPAKFSFSDVEKFSKNSREAGRCIEALLGQKLIERIGKPKAPGTHYVKSPNVN